MCLLKYHPCCDIFKVTPNNVYKTNHLSTIYDEFTENIESAIIAFNIPPHPPWPISPLKIGTGLHLLIGKQTPIDLSKSRTLEYIDKWSSYSPIFTYGSKMDDKVSWYLH